MRYEFVCSNNDCQFTTEHIQPMSEALPESLPCPLCASPSHYKFSAPAIVGERKNESFDAAVGRDSERRWSAINDRQAQRDQVRRNTGEVGLVATSHDTFTPIPAKQKEVRTQVTDAAAKQGYRPEE